VVVIIPASLEGASFLVIYSIVLIGSSKIILSS
jgi:hypothetical protein